MGIDIENTLSSGGFVQAIKLLSLFEIGIFMSEYAI
jgi:hypothetical protein